MNLSLVCHDIDLPCMELSDQIFDTVQILPLDTHQFRQSKDVQNPKHEQVVGRAFSNCLNWRSQVIILRSLPMHSNQSLYCLLRDKFSSLGLERKYILANLLKIWRTKWQLLSGFSNKVSINDTDVFSTRKCDGWVPSAPISITLILIRSRFLEL